MPTPVSTARQCLTEEAARALDDAVAVARRRSHAQTTSLHAVSALLTMPSSTLREACSRAGNSPRLQFRALELSVSVSLDRLPTAKTAEEPAVSNSLMAAIKRAQANQRRHPETFHLYQQQAQNSASSLTAPSISSVKIELKHFILSILDDPIVSRVFGEAGFRSPDIKIAVLSPPSYSLFSKRRGFNFPFSGYLVSNNQTNESDNSNANEVYENSRRIGEVLLKRKAKNPLLVGICAIDALKCFIECLEKRKGGVLPDEISGLSFISIEKEVSEFVSKGVTGSDEMMKMKFKEVNAAAEGCELLVNFGDLRVLVESESMDCVRFVVLELSRLVEGHGRRLRLIGATGSDNTYRTFVDWFPSIDKDWDLQLLPITSSRTYSMGGAYPKSSLLGSFVPFGGFFSLPSELENIRSSKVQFTGRCSICNENYEREVSALKERYVSSISGNSTSNIPSWLQKVTCGPSKSFDAQEAKDDRMVSAARFMGLQKKWNDICQRLHFSASSEMSEARSHVTDLQNVSVGKQTEEKSHSLETGSFPCAEDVVQCTKSPLEIKNTHNPTCSMLSVSQPLDCMVGQSRISVTTELQLGALYAKKDKGFKDLHSQEFRDLHKHLSCSVSSERTSIDPSHLSQSYSSISHLAEMHDSKDFKKLYGALSDKVYWQEEAIFSISQIISHCRSGCGKPYSSSKGNVWLSFLGPDKVAKRKTAVALSEKLYGSRENLIAVDLSSKDSSTYPSVISANNLVRSDVNHRGMMSVDYIAEKLKVKPNSVVLLEDIGNADILLQNSLLKAIKTGKFPNSHGREISISNMIFLMTSNVSKDCKDLPSAKPSPSFPEERIIAARDLEMRIVVEDTHTNHPDIHSSNIEIIGTKDVQIQVSQLKRILSDNSDFNSPKRMRVTLDLNMPVQEMEEDDDDSESHSYSDEGAESSTAWLEEISGLSDEKVVFKPFNFDSLAEKILMDLRARFQDIVGSSSSLEIEAEVIVQIIAAAWLSDSEISMANWVEQVLCRSFLEAKQMWNLTDKTVMKLVTCEGLPVKDHAPGIHLPAKINVN